MAAGSAVHGQHAEDGSTDGRKCGQSAALRDCYVLSALSTLRLSSSMVHVPVCVASGHPQVARWTIASTEAFIKLGFLASGRPGLKHREDEARLRRHGWLALARATALPLCVAAAEFGVRTQGDARGDTRVDCLNFLLAGLD